MRSQSLIPALKILFGAVRLTVGFALALALACPALATEPEEPIESEASQRTRQFMVALRSLALRAKNLTVRESVDLPEGADASSIRIGSEALGFIRPRGVEVSGGVAQVTFSPPSYSAEVSIVSISSDEKTKRELSRKRYLDPRPELIKRIECEVEGTLESPFFLTTVALEDPLSTNLTYLSVVINKLCEIVAYHVPFGGGALLLRPPVVKNMGGDNYLLMASHRESYFERFSFEKGELLVARPREALVKYAVHDDFVCANDSCTEVFAWGSGVAYTRPASFSSSTNDWLRPEKWWRFAAAPVALRTAKVLKVDLTTNHPAVVWDSLHFFSPTDSANLIANSMLQANVSMGEYRTLHEKPSVFVEWGVRAHLDWMGATSIEQTDRGYLFAFSELPSIVLVDPYFRSIIWSIGNKLKGELSGRSDFLFGPAHAIMDGESRVVILDNSPGAMVDPELSSAKILVLSLNGNEFKLITSLDTKIAAPLHGNLIGVSPQTITAFLPSGSLGFDSIVEYRRDSHEVRGSLRLSNGYGAMARRAEALAEF